MHDSPYKRRVGRWRGKWGRSKNRGSLTSKQSSYRLPALAHVLGCGKNEDLQRRVQGIDTVIEKLTEGSGLFGSSSAEIRLKVSSLDTTRAPSSSIHGKQRVEAPEKTRDLRLGTVNSVKRLVEQQSDGPAVVHPAWTVLIQRGVVPQHGQEIDDDEHESRQGD